MPLDKLLGSATNSSALSGALGGAAHADGHLTETEQRRIWEHAVAQQLPSAILATLQEKLGHPPAAATLVSRATEFETKIEIYTASLMVIDENCEPGQHSLGELASQLQLPAPLVEALHASVAEPAAT